MIFSHIFYLNSFVKRNADTMSIESLFEAPEPKVGKNVLVVDDSAMMRHVVSQVVAQLGHRAIEATDGEDALSKAVANLSDLIVIDVDMPKKTGSNFSKNCAPRRALCQRRLSC